MKVKDILMEMPKLILGLSDLDNLDLLTVNKSKYLFLSKLEDKEQLQVIDEFRILYNYKNMYFVLDNETKQILYYMQYETSYSSKLGGSFLWQSLIWRAKNVLQVKRLPHEIFFKILLPKYGTIITDGQQTDKGQNFWNYQIHNAINNNLNVYYYEDLSNYLEKINSEREFELAINKHDIWGDTKAHEHKLMVITSKIL